VNSAEAKNKAGILVKGAYDLHIHPAPSHIARCVNDDDLIIEASAVGIEGVMIKSHYETTNSRAILANQRHKGFGVRAFGSIALNESVGGLNPYAVQSTLGLGGSMVYLPTLDSAHSMKVLSFGVYERAGITVVDNEGELKKEVLEILQIVRDFDACLSTGHVGPQEAYAVCKAGKQMKTRIVLAHPEWQGLKYDLELQKEAAELGAYIEKCWLNIVENVFSAQYVANTIKEIGSDRVFMVTDHGQEKNEHPANAMISFIASMLECGISEEDVRNMVYTVPRKVVGSVK
jgi:hypothetical protein